MRAFCVSPHSLNAGFCDGYLPHATIRMVDDAVPAAALLMCRAGAPMSATEVRFKDLNIEADVFVGSRSLPSLTNDLLDYLQVGFY